MRDLRNHKALRAKALRRNDCHARREARRPPHRVRGLLTFTCRTFSSLKLDCPNAFQRREAQIKNSMNRIVMTNATNQNSDSP